MKRCPKCYKLLFRKTDSCSRCGWRYVEDRISFGLCVVSFLSSLFGLIYWLVAYRQTPRRATACGIVALVAPVVKAIIIWVIVILLIMLRLSLYI